MGSMNFAPAQSCVGSDVFTASDCMNVVVALPVARISVGPYWLRPACWAPVVFLVGKAETGPDQNHLHLEFLKDFSTTEQ